MVSIAACLKSVAFAYEAVVDSGSTNRTHRIAEAFGARMVASPSDRNMILPSQLISQLISQLSS